MNAGPLPTRLIFLSELEHQPPGSKVRFLGWYGFLAQPIRRVLILSLPAYSVTKYSTATGSITLQHAYPMSQVPMATALVDVNLLLSTLKTTDTQVGEWVNVVGYVEASNEAPAARLKTMGGESAQRRYGKDAAGNLTIPIRVQAIMLWSAGAIKVVQYERAVEERKRVEAGG